MKSHAIRGKMTPPFGGIKKDWSWFSCRRVNLSMFSHSLNAFMIVCIFGHSHLHSIQVKLILVYECWKCLWKKALYGLWVETSCLQSGRFAPPMDIYSICADLVCGQQQWVTHTHTKTHQHALKHTGVTMTTNIATTAKNCVYASLLHFWPVALHRAHVRRHSNAV